MKKTYLLLSIIVLVFLMIVASPMVKAGNGSETIATSGTYDLSSYGNGATISINAGLAVKLTNTTGNTYTCMKIICGQGVSLTINNVKINDSDNDDCCALSFTGSGNHLYLIGSSFLRSRTEYAGITVNIGTSLEISGEGSLEARGGQFAAGIGSNSNTSSGTITISGGTITAIGGKGAAGIGGGYQADNDTIVIKGGTVIAKGGYTTSENLGGAGIGGGGGDGSNSSGDGGMIIITGGTVNAVGADKGAGIGGGGDFNTAGTISIQGGVIFAEKGDTALYDIGNGENGSGGSLSIGGNSVVFLKNGLSLAPTTTTHTLVTASTITGHTAFGYSIPETWIAPVYAYIKNQTYGLIYNANGGLGTVPDKVTQNINTTVNIAEGKGLTNGTEIFKCWNTKADSTGTKYEPGNTFTFTEDTTLYAIYYAPVHVTSVILSNAPEAMEVGETITLTATVLPEDATSPEVTWTSSNEAVATVDNTGKVTALSIGETTITANADGISDTCDINVNKRMYAITFNLQGGGDSYIVKVDPDGDKRVPVQSNPVWTGYTFVGWYKEKAGINEWDFNNDTVTGDMTLYAVWKQDGMQFSGSGTETNPLRITSATDLARLATLVNAGNTAYNGGFYIQTQDIDLSGYPNWTPIGTSPNMFKGVYNGNNNKLYNLSITTPQTQYIGLFGYVNGYIKNLIIGSGYINISDNNSLYIGGIAGYLGLGTIENCKNASNIKIGDSRSNNKYAGGIVGEAIGNSNINNCINNGNLNIFGDIVDIGGIAGLIDKGIHINECANYGDINSYGYDNINGGGILGISPYESSLDYKSTITQCFNSGYINITGLWSSFELGGIVGFSGSTDITDCFNTGNLNTDTTSSGDGGGIAGRAGEYLIKNCYNMGYINSPVYKGGIAGAFYGVFDNNYFYDEACSKDIAIGSHYVNGVTLEQMKQKSTYSGFDFDTVWTMNESDKTGYEYPQLQGNLIYTEKHNVSLNSDSVLGNIEGEGGYDLLDTVTIKAKPKTGYTFTQWTVVSGGIILSSPTSATATFSMPLRDVSITATFEKTKYIVIMQNDGNGTATGSGSYEWGDTVSLTATANSNYEFMYWEVKSGDATIADTLDPSISFTMPQSDVTIEAYFDINPPSKYEYSISNEKATITKYTSDNETMITIPYKLGGYRVTAIGDKAFDSCNVTKVTIPYTVETIGSGIFKACNNLTNIIIDEKNSNFKSVDNVLYNTAGTRLIAYLSGKPGSYSIPQGIIDIDDYAFCNRMLLTGISIPDSVVNIGCGAFEDCTSINNLIISDSVTSIGDHAFYCCTGVTNLAISRSAETIGSYAFGGCTGLSTVTIPDSVTSIGDNAFGGCSNISSLRLGKSVSSIGDYALSGLNITRIDMPKSLSSMGDYVFKGCTVLRSVYFWGPKPLFSSYTFNNISTIYYHVKNVASWSLYSGAHAFCMFTKDLKDGQPPSTDIVYLNNDKVPSLTDPVWHDHTFESWYEPGCSSKWEDEPFFDDFTLYAKWSPGPYLITIEDDHLNGDVKGEGSYNANSMVNLHAIPEDGCRFVGWFINKTMVSDKPDYSFAAIESSSYTAAFDKINTPKIASAIFIGDSSLQATWDTVPGVTGYELWRSASKDGQYIKVATLSGISYSDTGLSMNSTYYYKVNAYYLTDMKTTRGDESLCVSGKTAPAAPEMVTAISTGYKSIEISWGQVSGATVYQVFRSKAKSGTYSFLYSTISTNYLDNNLKTGTCYYYKVCANNNSVSSGFSETAFSVPVLSSVSGLKSTVSSVTSVKLSWKKQGGSGGYEIWRSTSPDIGYLKIGSTKSTSYSNKGVVPNIAYYYKVRAYCKVGKSYVPGDYSESSASTTVLPKVTGVTGSIYKMKSVKLHWNTIKGVKGYEIWRSLSTDSGFAYISSTGGTKYKDPKLTPNVTYYYRIRAYVIINGVRYYSNGDSDTVSIIP